VVLVLGVVLLLLLLLEEDVCCRRRRVEVDAEVPVDGFVVVDAVHHSLHPVLVFLFLFPLLVGDDGGEVEMLFVLKMLAQCLLLLLLGCPNL
jgi:hypothetical protein